ncbi:MAG TPA: DUF2282 domain-containing protein [Nevskiaceae bacterium]|nr:DUF2282 domain-containing protein [Nevskiaceae bacterium]
MHCNKVAQSALMGVVALGMAWAGSGVAVAGTPSDAAIKHDPKPPRMTAAIIRNRTKLFTDGWVKCYGINAADKNTCHTVKVNCGNEAPARDPDAYVAVPKGLCTRIAGGSLVPRVSVQAAKAHGMQLTATTSDSVQ